MTIDEIIAALRCDGTCRVCEHWDGGDMPCPVMREASDTLEKLCADILRLRQARGQELFDRDAKILLLGSEVDDLKGILDGVTLGELEPDCDWCRGGAGDFVYDNGFSGGIDGSGKMIISHRGAVASRNINYCPMCGKRLKPEVPHENH